MSNHQKLAKTAGLISGLTMVSRVFGYVRDGLGGAILGAGFANDAYLAAFRIPNLLRDLFAEGALSSAFVPTFTSTWVHEGRERAWQLVSTLVNVMLLIMSVLVILGELGAPVLVHAIVPGFGAQPEKIQLTIRLTRILFPFLAFISFAALLMGILNSRERFGISAFAPVMLNLAMIAGGIFFCPWFGKRPEQQVVGWAWASMIGGFFQMAVQIPSLLRLGYVWRPWLVWKDPALRRIFMLMGPAVLGLSVTQINLFLNTLIASFLPEGSVTYLYYGNRLMQLPLGVFGVAIATALLPVTSTHLAKGERGKVIETLSFGLRLLIFITVPAAVGMIVLSEPINRLLFEYGRFHSEAVVMVSQASIYYTLGLVAFAGIKVLVPTFYALNDAKTPVRIAVGTVALNILLNLLLMRPLGFRGLALSTTLSAVVNFGALFYLLRRRLGGLDTRKLWDSAWRILLASAVMGYLVWSGSQGWLPRQGSGLGRGQLAYRVFSLIGFGGFGYLAFAWFFKVPEQKRVWNLIRKKVGWGGAGESWME